MTDPDLPAAVGHAGGGGHGVEAGHVVRGDAQQVVVRVLVKPALGGRVQFYLSLRPPFLDNLYRVQLQWFSTASTFETFRNGLNNMPALILVE